MLAERWRCLSNEQWDYLFDLHLVHLLANGDTIGWDDGDIFGLLIGFIVDIVELIAVGLNAFMFVFFISINNNITM